MQIYPWNLLCYFLNNCLCNEWLKLFIYMIWNCTNYHHHVRISVHVHTCHKPGIMLPNHLDDSFKHVLLLRSGTCMYICIWFTVCDVCFVCCLYVDQRTFCSDLVFCSITVQSCVHIDISNVVLAVVLVGFFIQLHVVCRLCRCFWLSV